MEYEQYINKKVKMQVEVGNNLLTYTCTIISVDNSHVSIIDMFGEKNTFRIQDIVQISEKKGTKP